MSLLPIQKYVMSILLTTLNARYTHASLGLRYLLANMGELQEQTRLSMAMTLVDSSTFHI